MSESAEFSIVRFSTAGLPEKDRIAMWREHYGRVAMKLDIEPAKDTAFDCEVVARSLPEMQLLSAAASPLRVTRTREFIEDGNDNVVFIINQTGGIDASARGQEVTLREGDAILMSSTEVGVVERRLRGGSLSLLIPRSALASSVAGLDDALMQRIPQNNALLKLLTSYGSALFDESLTSSTEVRRTTASHLHDLVALVLGATRSAANIAKYRGLRAARLNAAKTYVIENSKRRDLSVKTVAAHIGVTPRILQRLFEREGTTFTAFLLSQRLNRALRILTEPNLDRRFIGQIGYDVGFNDLSYFHRTFKRCYGATPLEIRNEAARPGVSGGSQ
jgi:AraC-like DNA-binding protein